MGSPPPSRCAGRGTTVRSLSWAMSSNSPTTGHRCPNNYFSGTWEPSKLALRPAADLEALGLDFRLGTAATGLNASEAVVELADGSVVPYDGLVIATGVRPRALPGTRELSGMHVLRTLSDATALRARLHEGNRLVIIGAGFIGAEVAATARGLGVEVTMLEAATVPLARAVGEAVGLFLVGCTAIAASRSGRRPPLPRSWARTAR